MFLITGGRGQLGSEFARLPDTRALSSTELDIRDGAMVDRVVADLRAGDVVINTAAYTAVDAAESDPFTAGAVNAEGAANLARACARHDIGLIQVSTDYVFAGDATRPYEPNDPTGPKSVYGRTKLDGERAVLDLARRAWVVRTSWVYGGTGGNFVKTIARLERDRDTLAVVDDQTGSPTWSRDLADGLAALATTVSADQGPEQRVLHFTGAGETTWFGFARAIFAELGADPERVTPCPTAEQRRPAPRPAYSVLSPRAWSAAGLPAPRPWREALAVALATERDAFTP